MGPPFAPQDHLPGWLQGFTIRLALHFSGCSRVFSSVPKRLIRSTEPLSPIPGAPECYRPSLRAGPSRQCPGWAARENLFHLWPHHRSDIFGWIQNVDFVGHQLQHVLIAGDDEDLERLLRCLAARVPITSSASKPFCSRIGMRYASSARRM